MYILLCKEGVILKQYYNDNFIEFNEFDTYISFRMAKEILYKCIPLNLKHL